MSKKVRQSKRKVKQSLKKRRACSKCMRLAIISDMRETYGAGVAADVDCPFCLRPLKLVIDEELLKDDLYRDAVFTYGRLVAEQREIPASLFTFLLNGIEFLSDPPCGCVGECSHNRLNVKLVTSESN